TFQDGMLTITSWGYQGGDLIVGATPGNDAILVDPGGGPASIRLSINGVSTTLAPPSGRIIIYRGPGDDAGSVPGGIQLPVIIFGGDGNDTLSGGNGPNVLVGGAGADTLSGDNDRDLLIGGTGADVVRGVAGDDILIGGSTAYDNDPAALQRIMAEWLRTD